MGLDVKTVRSETPATSSIVHVNNAGCSLPPLPVVDAVVEHLQLEAQEGGYEAESLAAMALEDVYQYLARLLNCEANQVALFESATIAWSRVFNAIKFRPGDRILTNRECYGSNYLALLDAAQLYDARVEIVPQDCYGQLDLDQFQNLVDEHVRLIAITHVPANGGLIQPVARIGEIARQADTLFFVDGCQSVGQLPVDVQYIQCDVLTFTGRKYLRAPRGTGGLFIRPECLDIIRPTPFDPSTVDWPDPRTCTFRDGARILETREKNVALQLGLRAALSYALNLGVEHTWPVIARTAERLRDELQSIPSVILLDKGNQRCGLVSFMMEKITARHVKRKLREVRINVGLTTFEQTPVDMHQRGLTEILRASLHYFNNSEDVVQVVEAVAEIAASSRARGC